MTIEPGWPSRGKIGGVGERMWMLATNAGPMPKVDIHTSPKADIEAAFRARAT
ncbi:MAG: hypothetical protein QM770_20200 [Tepidisphaeraceae bacterium]